MNPDPLNRSTERSSELTPKTHDVVRSAKPEIRNNFKITNSKCSTPHLVSNFWHLTLEFVQDDYI